MKNIFWKGQPFLKFLNITYASRVWGASSGGSKGAVKSKMERFGIRAYRFQSLTNITKYSRPPFSCHNIESYGEGSLINVCSPRNDKKFLILIVGGNIRIDFQRVAEIEVCLRNFLK